jgi:hypothetical protein
VDRYSDLDPEKREHVYAYINRRWGQLYQLDREWGQRGLNYLMLTNSGGAVAILSFLGASEGSVSFHNGSFFEYLVIEPRRNLAITNQFRTDVVSAKEKGHREGWPKSLP